MQSIYFHAMGCAVMAALDPLQPARGDPLARVPVWLNQWERQLSRYRPGSALSRLNSSHHSWRRVSRVLWDILQIAIEAIHWSDGLVVPIVVQGGLAADGGDHDDGFPGSCGRRRHGAAPIGAGRRSFIRYDPSTHAVRLSAGVRLDLETVARGWAADRAARRLGVYGPALVDVGGSVAATAPPIGESGWQIPVAEAFAPDGMAALLYLSRGGLATSRRSDDRRDHGALWRRPVLDPRTGRPAQTDVVSATVIAPTAYRAQVSARAALILGSTAGLAWIESHPMLAGLLVLNDGRIVQSRGLKNFLRS